MHVILDCVLIICYHWSVSFDEISTDYLNKEKVEEVRYESNTGSRR